MALNLMYAFYFAFMICCFVIIPVYGLHKISRMYPSSRQHRRSKYGWSRFKTLLKAYSIVLIIMLSAALPHIGKLVDFIPSLDTIVPMLRSFQGMVNFEAAAETALDSNLNVRIPTLRSAVHIKGDSLVLMDGETFAEISKMLRFKNKERNVFDSISVNLTVDDGKVTVYPFLLQIDRYQAAVGGTQGLDMNFDYHISILKWPIPLLKIGVNVTGNAADLDHVKIKLGKAKYKDAVTPVEIRRIDSTRINMGERIVNDFQKVMIRGNRKMPALAE